MVIALMVLILSVDSEYWHCGLIVSADSWLLAVALPVGKAM